MFEKDAVNWFVDRLLEILGRQELRYDTIKELMYCESTDIILEKAIISLEKAGLIWSAVKNSAYAFYGLKSRNAEDIRMIKEELLKERKDRLELFETAYLSWRRRFA